MIRFLYFPLTAILITLAVMFQNVWLYAAAGIVVVSGLAVLALPGWRWYQDNYASSSASNESLEEPSLDDLGITEIRPKSPAVATKQPAQQTASSSSQGYSKPEPVGSPKPSKELSNNHEAATKAAPSSEPAGQPTATSSQNDQLYSFISDRPLNCPVPELLEGYLKALHSSIRAHTVCVLGLNIYADNYTVEAALSKSAHIQQKGRITLDDHFLQNVSPTEPVTILVSEGETPAIDELGYYADTVNVDQVAVAPIQIFEETAGYLLADRTPKEMPTQTVYYTLLTEFAQLLGLILYTKIEDRPRREIINEEITRTRKENRPLALALVHPNNTDPILQKGPKAIAETEHLLKHLLQETTPTGRIERFGELIYGIFYYEDSQSIDNWAQRVQNAFGQQNQSVSIGVAIYGKRHESAEELRADAAEALRVAYETGQNECVIFE